MTQTHIHTRVETFSCCPPALLKFTCISTSGSINTLQSSQEQLLRIKLTDNWDQMACNDSTSPPEEEKLPELACSWNLKAGLKKKGLGMLSVLLVTTSMCVRTGSKRTENKERKREERRGGEGSIFWTVRLSASSVLCKFGWPHQENGVYCSDQHPSHLQKISESGKQLLIDDARDNDFTSYRKSILLLCEYVPCFSWDLQSALVQWL